MPQSSSAMRPTAMTLTSAPASVAPVATASASVAVCPKPEWKAIARLGAATGDPLFDMLFRLLHRLVDLMAADRPVRQLGAGEVGLQAVEKGVCAAEESAGIAHTEA